MAKVLVIDNHESARVDLAALLQELGHDARFAKDGRDGIARYGEARRRHRYDLVLLELGLGHENGLRVMAAIAERFPDARVIAMSADPGELLVAEIQGAYRTLVKPLQGDAVREAVEDVLAISASSATIR